MDYLLRNTSTKKSAVGVQWPEVQYIDKQLRQFISSTNGGYYFENALHLFGRSETEYYHDQIKINTLVHKLFTDLPKTHQVFGENIFGDIFLSCPSQIRILVLESGLTKVLCANFEEFAKKLELELDSLVGADLSAQLSYENKVELARGKRLGAKLPFVLGGNYDFDNFVLKEVKENISFGASIARQIKDFPDGASFEIEIT